MHLHGGGVRVPARLVLEAVQREFPAQLAVDPPGDIEIEVRCDAFAVVVRGQQGLV
jgi:hypothetical protein